MRALWWLPVCALALALTAVGLRYGWIATQVTETDVITHYAQKYVSDHGLGARPIDCVARPGNGFTWIELTCSPREVQGAYVYHVNRLGRLIHATRPMPPASGVPQT